VTELPPLRAEVTEYQCLAVDCPRCGYITTAELPAEHRKPFGPQLIALIAFLTVQSRMPRRISEQFLRTVLQVPISLGRVQQAVEEAGAAVAPACQELQQQLPKEPVLNVDETGWKTNGKRRWMWAFVAAQFVYYWIDASRGKKVLEQILGPVFRGILCTDRWAVYLSYHKGSAQLCWAHLKRDLLGIVEVLRSPTALKFARAALAQVAQLFRLWHRYRGNGLSREQFETRAMAVEKKLFALAEAHVNAKEAEVRALARVIFLQTEKLFTFVEQPGVEPTNNRAEQALRAPVQWRKISFGNRSHNGELTTGCLLTALRTCSMQERNPFHYLVAAIRCQRLGFRVPSLLPQTT
jgi:transposase